MSAKITYRVCGKCACSGDIIESRGPDLIKFCAKCDRDFLIPEGRDSRRAMVD